MSRRACVQAPSGVSCDEMCFLPQPPLELSKPLMFGTPRTLQSNAEDLGVAPHHTRYPSLAHDVKSAYVVTVPRTS